MKFWKKSKPVLLILVFALRCVIPAIAQAEGENIPVSSISVTAEGDKTILLSTEFIQLTAAILPLDASNQQVTWSSDTETVATVSQSGQVTAIAQGTAVITAAAQDGSGVTGTLEIAVKWFAGDGTESNPFRIANKVQLNHVRDDLEAYYRMENDITFSENDFSQGGAFYNDGSGFIPIGNSAASFRGVFDGAGYSITGLYQNINLDTSTCFAGLFGYMGSGQIKNLDLKGGTVTAKGTGMVYAGGVAGQTNSASIINCSNSGSVTAASVGTTTQYIYAGGIVGWGACNIDHCKSSGNISIEYNASMEGKLCAGGIAGYNYHDISHCINTGDISISGSNYSYAGGIVGYLHGSVSYNSSSTVSDSYNTGKVSSINGINYTGGIAGYSATYNTFINCFNTGEVCATHIPGVYGCASSAGGIVGRVFSNNRINGCYNTGTVSSASVRNNSCAGGIIGKQESEYSIGTVSDCYNTGSINAAGELAPTFAGGIAGAAQGVYSNCYNAGSLVSSAGSASGIVSSSLPDVQATNCYFLDNVAYGYNDSTAGRSTQTQLTQADTFIGFDFIDMWSMQGNSVYLYPELQAIPMVSVSGISIYGPDTVIRTKTLQMNAKVLPSEAYDDSVAWSVVNGTGEASIDTNGLLTAIKAGAVIVKATARDGSGIVGSKTIIITPLLVSSITVTSDSDTVVKAGTLQMSATVLPANADDKSFTWSVENGAGEASIDGDGLLTTIKAGAVIVKATGSDGSGIVGSKTITITPLQVDSITVTSGSDTVVKTGTLQMSATVLPANADDKSFTWSVENGTGEASIDGDGLLTAIKAGAVIVKATASDGSGIAGSKTITITPLQEKKLMGNVNLDDGLTAADAASILRLLVHLENWEDAGRNFALGDCNFSNTREDAYGNWVIGHEVDGVWTASDDPADRNNAVTAADASAILRFLVHLENTWYYNDHSYYMLNGVVMLTNYYHPMRLTVEGRTAG